MEPQPVQYVTADGQPLQMEGQPVQYVMAEQPQPVQYVTADGQPVQLEYAAAAPVQYAPPVFNISPDQFALLMQGGSLSQAEIDAMLSGSTPPAVAEAPVAEASAAEPSSAGVAAPSAAASKKASSKKKKLASKKKSKGCC